MLFVCSGLEPSAKAPARCLAILGAETEQLAGFLVARSSSREDRIRVPDLLFFPVVDFSRTLPKKCWEKDTTGGPRLGTGLCGKAIKLTFVYDEMGLSHRTPAK